jgi:hypothetical protein
MEITTPETALESPTRLNSSVVRSLAAMKPSTETRATWAGPITARVRSLSARPAVTTTPIRATIPSTRQNESLRRNLRRSAIISASVDMLVRPLLVARSSSCAGRDATLDRARAARRIGSGPAP